MQDDRGRRFAAFAGRRDSADSVVAGDVDRLSINSIMAIGTPFTAAGIPRSNAISTYAGMSGASSGDFVIK